jgi:hypothetical protein
VWFGSTVHGTLPAFPVLGAVPSGPATVPVWLLAGATPFVAGALAARAAGAGTPGGWRAALRNAAVAVVFVALGGFVLAWQGGGSIGSGRLSTFGASPWQFGLSVAGAVAGVATAAVGALGLLGWWRARQAVDEAERPALAAVPAEVHEAGTDDVAGDDAEAGILAG